MFFKKIENNNNNKHPLTPQSLTSPHFWPSAHHTDNVQAPPPPAPPPYRVEPNEALWITPHAVVNGTLLSHSITQSTPPAWQDKQLGGGWVPLSKPPITRRLLNGVNNKLCFFFSLSFFSSRWGREGMKRDTSWPSCHCDSVGSWRERKWSTSAGHTAGDS